MSTRCDICNAVLADKIRQRAAILVWGSGAEGNGVSPMLVCKAFSRDPGTCDARAVLLIKQKYSLHTCWKPADANIDDWRGVFVGYSWSRDDRARLFDRFIWTLRAMKVVE